jgi:hypothetical protein
MAQEDLEEVIEDPLGDDDIRTYLPNAKIIKYSELSKYGKIEDLLVNDKDFCVILYEDSPNKGHWTCISRYNNILEFFDSYGGYPDSQLGWTDKETRKELHQCKTYLTDLFNKSKFKIIFNPIKYQEDGNDINTCGRHCVFRILNLIRENRDLHQYYLLMQMLKKETNETYDEIVANVINKT